MRRLMMLSLVLIIGLLPLAVAAQEPVTTSEPPSAAAPAQQPTEAPPAAPTEPPANDPIQIMVNARGDLELLANATMNGQRPEGWNGNLDVNNSQFPILVRLDLETLTGTLLGADTRPPGWFGPVPSTAFAIARDVRHDLELLADTVSGLNVRPPGWVGADPIMRCGRAVQNLVSLLEQGGLFTLNVDPGTVDYCDQAERQASVFAEANLYPKTGAAGNAAPGAAKINSKFAVAFLDKSATKRAGIMPDGTAITPVARSAAQFSHMMLVSGVGFEVYVDYQFTTVSEDQFNKLPDAATLKDTPSCTADWCKVSG